MQRCAHRQLATSPLQERWIVPCYLGGSGVTLLRSQFVYRPLQERWEVLFKRGENSSSREELLSCQSSLTSLQERSSCTVSWVTPAPAVEFVLYKRGRLSWLPGSTVLVVASRRRRDPEVLIKRGSIVWSPHQERQFEVLIKRGSLKSSSREVWSPHQERHEVLIKRGMKSSSREAWSPREERHYFGSSCAVCPWAKSHCRTELVSSCGNELSSSSSVIRPASQVKKQVVRVPNRERVVHVRPSLSSGHHARSRGRVVYSSCISPCSSSWGRSPWIVAVAWDLCIF